MAGQGPSRRELLQALTLASAAATFPGFVGWRYAFAQSPASSHHASHGPSKDSTSYKLQFFSPAEYATIEILADLILPATDDLAHPLAGRGNYKRMPGAKEAGAAEFIDFMVYHDPSLQQPFRSGLAWIHQASAPATDFNTLAPALQGALLQRLAYTAHHRDGEGEGQAFFKLCRRYTVMGFYTTRIGLEALDYPGLTFYGSSPACTHTNDPEHLRI